MNIIEKVQDRVYSEYSDFRRAVLKQSADDIFNNYYEIYVKTEL